MATKINKKEKTALQGAEILDLQITLQDIIDDVEDEILVIDEQYRIRFVNSAVIKTLRESDESPVGKLC